LTTSSQEDKNRIVFLTLNARSFLAEMREQAAENDSVYLSGKQAVWLRALHERARSERERLEQWRESERVEAEKPKVPVASGGGGSTLH
jgi:hypothetical protein